MSFYQSRTFWNKVLGPSWASSLGPSLLETHRMETNMIAVDSAYVQNKHNVFPEKKDIFKAFRLCPMDNVKVIIVTNEPYRNSKATGLALANPEDTPDREITPALSMLEDAIERQYKGEGAFMDKSLEKWAKQGVLLLNSTLITSVSKKNVFYTSIFKEFVIKVIDKATYHGGVVVVILGDFMEWIETKIHKNNKVIKLPHPNHCYYTKSPLEIDFADINTYLHNIYGKGISWVDICSLH